MKITVVALGKIGLPLAVQFARKGHSVFGVDINDETISKINRGIPPFPGEENLDQYLAQVINNHKLTATSNVHDAVSQSDAVVVVTPLFVENSGFPDFHSMDEVTKAIGKALKPRTLVSYETTLPVGTTRTRFAPALEKHSGLRAGEDFYLVFSPERVMTGRVFEDLRKYPKLIGGVNISSVARGIEFYTSVLDFDERPELVKANGVWNLGSCEAAELAKLAETTYRDVNIALANQFAMFAESHSIDIANVISACNSQPFSHIHEPGIAVGGHCIPVYSRFYMWNDPVATVVKAARQANDAMPEYAVNNLEKIHGDLNGQRIVILGASYRGGVKETAFSGVFPISSSLIDRGAIVLVHDPLYSDDELSCYGFKAYHFGDYVDAAIVQADHALYRSISSESLPGIRSILDGRGILNESNWPSVKFHQLGRSTAGEKTS